MKKTNLRQLKRNLHGVSVVIGALMLTLIVVTAAASFAIFTAQKQEELQEQEFAQLLREQEELSVNKIVDLSYNSDGNLSTISFSIANQHTRSSKIVVLKINDHVISDFNVTDQINQQMQGWTLKGKYYRTAYFANDTDGNLYIFDDLNGNHKADQGEEILDNEPDGGEEADPGAGNQGYLYAKDSNGEPYLFNDTDFDGVYTTEKDFIIDSNGNDPNTFGWNDISNLSSKIGDELNPYYSSVNGSLYYADLNDSGSFDPIEDVFWDNNTNGFDNNDKCLSSGKGSSIIERTNLTWFKNSDNIAISGDDIIYDLKEDIIIDMQGGGTYSAEKEYNRSLDFNYNNIEASPASGDRGGIYPEFHRFSIDSLGQYIISIDNAADDMIYFGETLKQNDALTIEVQTDLTNTFEKSFIPPTANIKVKEEDDSFVLDGTDSFSHNYSNIVEWEWGLTNTFGTSLRPKFGRKVNANRVLVDDEGVTDKNHSFVNWIINLTVTDDFGMKGIASFNHTQDFKSLMTESENLQIVDFRANYSNEKIDYINFSIKSNYEFDSNITELFINNINCIGNFTPYMSVKNYSTSNDIVQVNFSNPDQIDLSKPVVIKFKTAFGNTFEKTFYPPNAIIRIQTESLPGVADDYYILDGSLSDHPGEGYIVSWRWNVTNISSSPTKPLTPEPVGRKAMISNNSFINATESYKYRVNLTVIDNFNMIGKSTFIFKP